MATSESETVQLNELEKRFEIEIDGIVAFLEFRRSGSSLVLTHTEVPESLQEKGIGGKLVEGALAYAREQNLPVIPLCPFVEAYMRKHPETVELLDPAFSNRALN